MTEQVSSGGSVPVLYALVAQFESQPVPISYFGWEPTIPRFFFLFLVHPDKYLHSTLKQAMTGLFHILSNSSFVNHLLI
jgi:hypothetical protein